MGYLYNFRMEYSIETEGLTREFEGIRAVDTLSLRVEKGSFFGFLGPNGAGKSTTIKILTGILAPTTGAARILGHDSRKHALAIKRRIGVVPEDLGLFENLNAREYLTFIGRMHGLPKAVILDRTEELLHLMDLETASMLTLEYSHGMRKKIALAAALIHDPELLFLDEPFEGIDAIAARTLRQVLEQFVSRGRTIFLTSHILDIVARLCTHVGIIQKGRLVCQGTLSEIAGEGTLEDAFIAATGHARETQAGLSWLERPGC